MIIKDEVALQSSFFCSKYVIFRKAERLEYFFGRCKPWVERVASLFTIEADTGE